MDLDKLSKISIALYLIAIGLLIVSAYQQGRGVETNLWRIPAYIALGIAFIFAFYLKGLRKKEKDRRA